MLSKRNRLSKKEILELLPKSKSLRGSFLLLRFKNLPEKNNFKAGVSISKKIAKSAVMRNKIRRIIYRELSYIKKNIMPANLFFVVNKIAENKELKEDVVVLLTKSGALKA